MTSARPWASLASEPRSVGSTPRLICEPRTTIPDARVIGNPASHVLQGRGVPSILTTTTPARTGHVVGVAGPLAGPPGLGPEPPPAVIEARGLRKSFGAIRAVDGIDLSLSGGRIYGLLGPNGSGKTTLIRLLAGLARPTSGSISVLGTRMPSRPLLAKIGYMTQSDGLYAELSVWENLSFFASMSG